MRLTFVFALVVTLHASGASLPSAKDTNTMVQNDASPAVTDLTGADGGRMLRRAEKDEDDSEEERRLFWSKLRVKLKLTNIAKEAKMPDKIKEFLKEAADERKSLEQAALMLKETT
ncbi:hypothetical protein PHYSODRAFT_288482 [Phytophthora sojae]|uniref:RxLR effector protein n=2 Tax=Phytophthora sojae TaxID=67593 RepID=G5A4Z9_PHYSP|nr:hypothetical protein PHYSODRAFT_288482 [Phytophthora sojae]AEK81162.1 Avh319 [Phytophthora sojae]AEK81163.1 Avh319 [Phytophthora sojae]AEK81164.1 Avh319 [Phytophthora sojae]EGZ09748.1 hypothetical protein PHYSODRAFT_288482 [Phytophthora sojae]|eukprot:XP_009534609.1 hypothetical protein PHYSODRAFT_288482 [Phytophthora sojae]